MRIPGSSLPLAWRWLLLFALLAELGAARAASPLPADINLDANGGEPTFLRGNSQYWIDPTGEASIDEVAADSDKDWQPYMPQPGSHHAIDGKALWLRFNLVAPSPRNRWMLEFMNPGTLGVTLYYLDKNRRWVAQSAGKRYPVSSWPIPGRAPAFAISQAEINLQAPEDRFFWLRIEHANTDFTNPIRLIRLSQMMQSRLGAQMMLGGVLGFTILVIVMMGGLALTWRNGVLAAYTAYLMVMLLQQLALQGLGAQYLWVNWTGWTVVANNVTPFLFAGTALWFGRILTAPRISMALDRIVVALIATMLALALWFGVARAPRPVYDFAYMLLLPVMLVMAALLLQGWRARRRDQMGWVALSFTPLIALTLLPLAFTLNLAPVSFLSRYGIVVGMAIQIPLLSYAILLRTNSRHEAQVKVRSLTMTDALTGAASARALNVRLESTLLRAKRQDSTFALLVIRITNLRVIVRSQGQQAGERALVAMLARLRRIIDDMDMAARIDDDTFALLLETPTSSLRAMKCNQRVAQEGARCSALLGTDLVVHTSVTMLPGLTMNAQAVLRQAIDNLPAREELHGATFFHSSKS